jgi:FkbM family methyltransferase
MRLLTRIEGHTLWAPALSQQSVVLDFGTNKGDFSHGVLKQFRCRCHSVEANPTLCESIPSHPSLAVYNLAIAATSGRLPFYLSEENCQASSILKDAGGGKHSMVEVESVRFDDFLNRIKLTSVDLIKFDIEGAEIEVFDSIADESLKNVGQMSVEFHDFAGLTPVETVKRVVKRLESLGFYTIKMSRHGWEDTLFVNRRIASVNVLRVAWSRYVTRNWWGLKRIALRSVRDNRLFKGSRASSGTLPAS